MTLNAIEDVERLKRINTALMDRVESVMDQQGNSFSLFQTAISLEGQVRRRTDELTSALRGVEKINNELADAKEAAEVANQSKTRFLAAASHDVLQPLNAALLSVSVLADLQTNPKGVALVNQVQHALETMNELLGTLLDISRLDAGVTLPIIEDVSLGDIFAGLESDFAPIAERRNLALRFRPTDIHVASDRTMLRRILQNLVSNGLSYTTEGGVLVGIRKRSDSVIIQVTDTGKGIPPRLKQAVFEEFYRGEADNNAQENTGAGLGLGLSIVKRMAAALEHELTMRSSEKSGTVFQLQVPMADAAVSDVSTLAALEKPKLMRGGINGKRVLLLENEPSVIDAMTALFDAWKCEIAIATNMQEALDTLNDTAWIPDLIVADQHLNQNLSPGDGFNRFVLFYSSQRSHLDAQQENRQSAVNESGRPVRRTRPRPCFNRIGKCTVKWKRRLSPQPFVPMRSSRCGALSRGPSHCRHAPGLDDAVSILRSSP